VKEKDQQAKRVRKMVEVLQDPTAGSQDVFSVVVNPNSFSETVENIFDLSVGIKEGKVRLKENKEGLPVVKAKEQPDSSLPPCKQSVWSFSIQDFHDVVEAFECTGEKIPARGKQ
jgi:hypothetical protein